MLTAVLLCAVEVADPVDTYLEYLVRVLAVREQKFHDRLVQSYIKQVKRYMIPRAALGDAQKAFSQLRAGDEPGGLGQVCLRLHLQARLLRAYCLIFCIVDTRGIALCRCMII